MSENIKAQCTYWVLKIEKKFMRESIKAMCTYWVLKIIR